MDYASKNLIQKALSSFVIHKGLQGLLKRPMTFALSANASVNALQQTLLEEAGLTTEGPNKASRFPDDTIADMLTTARIECLDSMEAYFAGDLQPTGCISARNEGAAISLILQRGIAGAHSQARPPAV